MMTGDAPKVHSCSGDVSSALAAAIPASDLPGVGLDGTSGHSHWQHLRFAFGGYGPWAAAIIALFAKDMYILKLGADAGRVGVIATVWSVLFPLMYPVSGYLMDMEPPLVRGPSGWGRRAPWFLSHLLPLAVIMGIIFCPGLAWAPPAGSALLDAWLAICLFSAAWCLAVLLGSFEAAMAEIYPFAEERSLVQAFTKVTGAMAAATGIVPQFLLWIVATLPARAGVGFFLFVAVLLSVEVVPILKHAQQPRLRERKASFRECLEVLQSPPMAHATALRFWHSAAETTAMNFGIYYLTFVDGLDSVQRAKWMMIAGIFVASMEMLLLTPLWGFMWSAAPRKVGGLGSSLRRIVPNMRSTCLALHLVGAVIPPLLLQLPGLGLGRPWEWVLSTIALRVCYSPQIFFRTNSFCWAVDDDCHQSQGSRREAVHAGVIKFFEEEGRALAIALFLGMGWAGLQTENCELLCADTDGDREACVAACDQNDIMRQPEAVKAYIDAVMTYVVPAFGLACALHIWLFPIHGKSLEALQSTQAVAFKDVRHAGALPQVVIGRYGEVLELQEGAQSSHPESVGKAPLE